MSPLIEPSELAGLAHSPQLVLVCAGSGQNDKSQYETLHLHNTVYLDLDKDLSEVPENAANGGRHPLPAIDHFARLVGHCGIGADSKVVVYDFNNGANAAARFWWMLRAVGHQFVKVLNGGAGAAIRAGFPADDQKPKITSKEPYPVSTYALPQVSIEEVEKALREEKAVVVDVRSNERFRGLSEPIDPVAGHIPGAINIPLSGNLDPNGRFLEPDKLRSLYQFAEKRPTIIHCGSGVTACHTILAMAAAGLPFPALYVGSWSEWCRSGRPIGQDDVTANKN